MWAGESGYHFTEDYRPGLLEREARMGRGSQPGISKVCRRSVERISCGTRLRVNRWLGITPSQCKDTKVSLHVFTDASCRAYAVAAYLRLADIKGNVTVNLVASRCPLAPLDGDTIPRLELFGALLGARLLNSLRSEYNDVLKIND